MFSDFACNGGAVSDEGGNYQNGKEFFHNGPH
jgi:hypothetical protein